MQQALKIGGLKCMSLSEAAVDIWTMLYFIRNSIHGPLKWKIISLLPHRQLFYSISSSTRPYWKTLKWLPSCSSGVVDRSVGSASEVVISICSHSAQVGALRHGFWHLWCHDLWYTFLRVCRLQKILVSPRHWQSGHSGIIFRFFHSSIVILRRKISLKLNNSLLYPFWIKSI